MTKARSKIFAVGLFTFLLTLFFLINSCIFQKKSTKENYYLTYTPPGVAKIDSNLFYDKTEMTNVGWREYMYWTERVFGGKSQEYKNTIPDTSVWTKENFCFVAFDQNYLRHPQYKSYPVVGITHEQALNYSKWRSDRVMEVILKKFKIIDSDIQQNYQNYFSIEKYFNGNYNGIIPDSMLFYYPYYRLPTISEYKTITAFKDTTDEFYYLRDNNFINSDKNPCDNFYNFSTKLNDSLMPLEPPYFSMSDANFNSLYQLHGNACEWTSEKNICVGGSWKHSKELIMKQDTFFVESSNAWTSFRNICEWKKWE